MLSSLFCSLLAEGHYKPSVPDRLYQEIKNQLSCFSNFHFNAHADWIPKPISPLFGSFQQQSVIETKIILSSLANTVVNHLELELSKVVRKHRNYWMFSCEKVRFSRIY